MSCTFATPASDAEAIDWSELASRDADGLSVSLWWSKAHQRVCVSVVDSRLDLAFEIDVPADEALEAFRHPFAYAAGGGSRFGDALRESLDLQLQD